jgi:uncharacterized membrane protein
VAASQKPLTKIAEQLPSAIPVEQRVKQVVAHHAHFQGPIPHPDIFRKYGEIVPDAPERILRVFEDDSKHARDIQVAALEAQKADNGRVHWMAWSLIMGGYILSVVFAAFDKDTLSGIILATTLTGTITGFIQSRSSHDKKSSEKK